MARVMTLEGLDPARLGEIRARLEQPELSWWRRPLGLGDAAGVFRAYSPWIAGAIGIVVGAALLHLHRGR